MEEKGSDVGVVDGHVNVFTSELTTAMSMLTNVQHHFTLTCAIKHLRSRHDSEVVKFGWTLKSRTVLCHVSSAWRARCVWPSPSRLWCRVYCQRCNAKTDTVKRVSLMEPLPPLLVSRRRSRPMNDHNASVFCLLTCG